VRTCVAFFPCSPASSRTVQLQPPASYHHVWVGYAHRHLIDPAHRVRVQAWLSAGSAARASPGSGDTSDARATLSFHGPRTLTSQASARDATTACTNMGTPGSLPDSPLLLSHYPVGHVFPLLSLLNDQSIKNFHRGGVNVLCNQSVSLKIG